MFWQEVYELLPKQADGLEVTSVTPQLRSVQQEPLQFYLRELRRLALQLMANCTLHTASRGLSLEASILGGGTVGAHELLTLPRYVCTCHNILIFELICACFCLVQCVNAWEG